MNGAFQMIFKGMVRFWGIIFDFLKKCSDLQRLALTCSDLNGTWGDLSHALKIILM